MNARAKGNQFQNWVANWFAVHVPGAVIHNQKTVSAQIRVPDKRTGEPRDIWVSKRQDILGCIDLVVIIPGKKPLFIQATLDTSVKKRLEELSQVPWCFDYCTVQLWQKKADGVHIKQFTGTDFADFGKVIRGKFYRLEGQDELPEGSARESS